MPGDRHETSCASEVGALVKTIAGTQICEQTGSELFGETQVDGERQ